MKRKIYNFCTVTMLLLSVSMWSCNEWLDVKPNDRITDKQLFSTEGGFKTALNGIYIDMVEGKLYGGEMLYDFVDILAQQYKFSGLTGDLTQLVNYDYTTKANEARIADIWEKYYAEIANCNKLLQFSGDSTVLKNRTKNIVIGETKALRAMLHFDVLRLFGPIYSQNPQAKSIPYNTEFGISATDLLPADKVVQKILEDLDQAIALLEMSDPILTKEARVEDRVDPFLGYRAQRMNYYAANALKARVCLWAGDKVEALAAAKKVIAVQKSKFPFVEYNKIVADAKNPDRIFSTELLFSLTHSTRAMIFDNSFSPKIKTKDVYALKSGLDDVFGSLKDKDFRCNPIWKSSPGVDFKTCHKYEQIENTDQYYASLIPLIRVSEMYYIVAECSTDPAEALAAMNAIYLNRGMDEVASIPNMRDAITAEFRKEFYAEGQLFFYYKRINQAKIMNLTENKLVSMTPAAYVIPLPKSETYYR